MVTLTFAGAEDGAVNAAVWMEVLVRLEVVEIRAGVTELQVPNDDWQPVPQ